jgi:hypothetical protein
MSLLGNGTSNSTHVGPQGFVDGGPVFNSALALLMFQLLLITFVSRCFGWLFRKLREPMVIAEMCAGIVLVRALRSWFRLSFRRSSRRRRFVPALYTCWSERLWKFSD